MSFLVYLFINLIFVLLRKKKYIPKITLILISTSKKMLLKIDFFLNLSKIRNSTIIII